MCQTKRPRGTIQWAVEKLVSKDSSEWKDTYVSKPLDFISEPGNKYGLSDELIDFNLDYLVDSLEENKAIIPSWGNSFYKGEFEPAWGATGTFRLTHNMCQTKRPCGTINVACM